MSTTKLPPLNLRCPVSRLRTLSIPVIEEAALKITSDARSCHILRQSLIVKIKKILPDTVTIEPVANAIWLQDNHIPVEDFGLRQGKYVWISPQAVRSDGVEQILAGLPVILRLLIPQKK